jgi:hypothetical protein
MKRGCPSSSRPSGSCPWPRRRGCASTAVRNGRNAQFLPKNPPDLRPQENDLAKLLRCLYWEWTGGSSTTPAC